MKKIAIVALMVLVLGMVGGPAYGQSLLPLKPGNWWELDQVGAPGLGETLRVIGFSNLFGVWLYTLEIEERDEWDTDYDFAFCLSTNTAALFYEGGLPFIAFKTGPVGTTWIYEGDVRATIAAVETVTVPAGTFTGCYHYTKAAYDGAVLF